MKLIIDGNTQDIELSGIAPTELRLGQDDLHELTIALIDAMRTHAELKEKVGGRRFDEDELEAC